MRSAKNEETIRKINRELEKVSVPTMDDIKKAYFITTIYFLITLVISLLILFVIKVDGTSIFSYWIKEVPKLDDFGPVISLLLAVFALYAEICGIIETTKCLFSSQRYEIDSLEHKSVCYQSTMKILSLCFLGPFVAFFSHMVFFTQVRKGDSIADIYPLIVLYVFVLVIIPVCRFFVDKNKVIKRGKLLFQLSALGAVGEHSSKAAVQEKTENMDLLIKYKALLDSGAITQEEFDQKKKELLGDDE